MTQDFVKVDSQDTLMAAVDDAMERAIAVFGDKKDTLIDMISQADWDSWDASGETPNVADSAGLNHEIDFDELKPVAA